MASISQQQNYINSKVFESGIASTLKDPNDIYLVLYHSTKTQGSGTILATTAVISGKNGKVEWTGSDSGGGTLKIKTVPSNETRDVIVSSDSSEDADMFAIISCNKPIQAASGLVDENSEPQPKVQFPDLDTGVIEVLVAGDLSAVTRIMKGSNFQFNESIINFQIQAS